MKEEQLNSYEMISDIISVNQNVLMKICKLVMVSCNADHVFISVTNGSKESIELGINIDCQTLPLKSSLALPILAKNQDLISFAELFSNIPYKIQTDISDRTPKYYGAAGISFNNKISGCLSILSNTNKQVNNNINSQLQSFADLVSEFIGMRYYIRQSAEELSDVLNVNQIHESAIKSMSEGVFAVDLSGKVLLYNPAAEELLGVESTNVEPEQWSEFYQCYYQDTNRPIPSEELPIAQAMMNGKPAYGEFNIIHQKRKERITISANASPIFKRNSDEIIGGVALFSNITELKKERNILHQTFNSAVDTIILINDKREIIFFNKTAENTFGYKADEVYGKNINIIVPEAELQGDFVENNLKTGERTIIGYGKEMEMFHKDGSKFWGHLSLGKIEAEGEIMFVAIIKDITEYINMRNSLREKRNELMALVESAPVALSMVDTEMRYLAASQQWMEDYGIVGKDVIGKTHYEIFPEISEEWKNIHKRAIMGETIKREVDPFYRSDGSVQWIRWTVRPWTREDGQIGGIIMMTEEVSKRIEIEMKLREAKETAEKISREKDLFLSNMSHEIRTPLNAINGIANILHSNNPRKDQKEYIDTLKISSNNLVLVVNDILDYAKLGTGQLSLLSNVFVIKNLLLDVIKIHNIIASEKGIYINLDYDESIPKQLQGDNLRISQVLNNLLGNAVKFTNTGGVAVIVKKNYIQNGYVKIHFEVADTGIGIDKKDHEKIFQQFHQADFSSTRKYGGTGLGLSICKGILNMMDSEITVESEPGIGARFSFEVLFEITENSLQNNKDESFKDFLKLDDRIKVLLVEDNRANQLVAGAFLKEWGVNFDVAENGLIAYEKVKESPNKYGIILMDLQMPVMDGYEASQKINEITQSSIPVISLSASVNVLTKKKAKDAGITDSITKPFEPYEFYHKLSSYIQLKDFKSKTVRNITSTDIDISFFTNLAEDDDELKRELLEAVIENVKDIKEEFPKAILNNDNDLASRQVHKIKSILTKIKKDDLWESIQEGRSLIHNNASKKEKEKYIKNFNILCNELIFKVEFHL